MRVKLALLILIAVLGWYAEKLHDTINVKKDYIESLQEDLKEERAKKPEEPAPCLPKIITIDKPCPEYEPQPCPICENCYHDSCYYRQEYETDDDSTY